MAYGRIARGFKSAAFNIDIVHSPYGLAAGPENATSYELGFKSDLFDNRARLNGAVFRTDYKDMQVSQLLGTAAYLTNAASAEINGAELEFSGYLVPDFRVDLGIGALDARYGNFDKCAFPTSLGGAATDCSGNQIIGAPDWTANAAAEYATTTPYGQFITRLDYRFESPVFYEATNSKRFESDSHNIFGARIGLAHENYDVFLWVRNLFDESYITYADDRSGLGVPRTTAYGEPRSFGATLSVHY
jgi:iron complex outermembrane receptor protein